MRKHLFKTSFSDVKSSETADIYVPAPASGLLKFDKGYMSRRGNSCDPAGILGFGEVQIAETPGFWIPEVWTVNFGSRKDLVLAFRVKGLVSLGV